MAKVTGELVSYGHRYSYFRIPATPTATADFRILTMPRATLRRGFATLRHILMNVDYRTLRHDGHGWVAKVELLSAEDD